VSLERLRAWCEERDISLLVGSARSDEVPGLSSGAVRGLRRFAGLVEDFSRRAMRLRIGPLVEELLERLDLVAHLRAEGPDGEERVLNVEELVAGAMEFEAELREEGEDGLPEALTELDLFLQQVALITDLDRHDPESDAVTFMTLHNAKGLEYPTVFISGLEEGLFPLARAYDEPGLLEEERRLFYVGITRARNRLHLTWARERRRGGNFMVGTLSSFVDDIPEDLLVERQSPALARQWGRGRSGGAGDGFEWRRGPDRRSTESYPDDAPADLEFEDEMNQDLPQMRRGERVSHPTFGSGRVVEVSGFGRDVRVTVDFQSVGRKKLLARYAGLERDF
jgi:DNA helicase-2/ATP-dependent DNA helicase PcrA